MARIESSLCVALVLTQIVCLSAHPPGLQVCGRELADALALVCHERGYNMPLKPEKNDERTMERRFKRGIVDECCKRNCNWSTLESYCSPSTTPSPDNFKLQKRSGTSVKKTVERADLFQPEIINQESQKQVTNKFSYDINDFRKNMAQTETGDSSGEAVRHHKRKLFGHTSVESDLRHPNRFVSVSSEVTGRHHGPLYKHSGKHKKNSVLIDKVKRFDSNRISPSSLEKSEYASIGFHPGSDLSDTVNTSDFIAEVVSSSNELNFIGQASSETSPHPTLIRHHRDHFTSNEKKHTKSDLRNKREKESDVSGGSGVASQIGTISPYFLGRTLVLPSSRKTIIPRQ